ncbi:DUF6221 family protein [Micromonospora tulbaghiae]|uniref:DUF6221 family protein n=1 Tax=Micromonospora tulbaghiae TaxID=479978 RepID=UPI00331C075F
MTDERVLWLEKQLDATEQLAQAYLNRREREGTDRETWAYKLLVAEVDVKRRVLARHAPEDHFLHGTICTWCSTPQTGAYQSWPCPDIRDSASPYAGEPGYREQWRPAEVEAAG